jgi:PAP2 superfamily
MRSLAAGIALVLCFVAAGADSARAEHARAGVGPVVVEWNEKTNEVAFAEDQFQTFKGARAYAMTHIAQHDALNAARPRFEQFAYFGRDRRAHPIAAAAQAAREVLVSEYPAERANIDALLAEQLAGVRDGRRKRAAIELGRRSAAAILAARRGDGYDFQGSYTFEDELGDYQTTPPFDGFVLQPGFRFARPFALASPSQFRPPPPPALTSRAYAAAVNEVKDTGRVDSESRTPDQTGYAVWWMEFVDGSVNRLARDLATRRGMGDWEAARLFAQLNAGLFDSYLAVWDAKFEHNHWRPYTAIRAAAADGNPRTSPDPSWEPLRTTPPFPEYVSAHSAACAGTLEVLADAFGNRTYFTMATTTAPPGMPTRSFRSFRAAADECADSRVRLGFHFRYATDGGKLLGRRVAWHILRHHFEPLDHSEPLAHSSSASMR